MVKKQKFLIILISAYGIVALLYAIAAAVVYFHKSNEIRNDRLNQSHREYVLQVRDKIDTQMTVALNVVQQLKGNPRLIQFNRETARDYYNITKLHEDLKRTVNSFSNYGLLLGVQKAGEDFIISSRSTSTASFYYADLTWNEERLEAVKAYVSGSASRDAVVMHNGDSDGEPEPFFTMVKKEAIAGGDDVIFYISFPTHAILPSLDERDGWGFAMSIGNRIVSMSSSSDAAVSGAIRSFDGRKADTPFGYSSYAADGYTFHSVGSMALPEAKYVYATRTDEAREPLNELLRDSLRMFLALLGAGALVIWATVAYSYRPYSRAMQAHEALLEITEKGKLSMKQAFLRDALFGRLSDDRIREGRSIVDLEHAPMPAVVVILELENFKEWAEALSADGVRQAAAQMQIIIQERFEEAIHEVLEVDVMRFAVVVFGCETDRLERLVYRLTSSIREGTGLEWIAVVGKPVPSFGQLPFSYQEALNLLEVRYAHANKPVMTMAQLEKLVNADYYYPLDVEKELIAYIARGKREGAVETIKKVVRENLERRKLTDEAMSQFLFSLTATANRAMQQLKWKSTRVFEEGPRLYSNLLNVESKAQLQTKIVDLFARLAEYQRSAEAEEEVPLADRLFEYIHSHYHLDLSLQHIADHFKVSQGYVGRMFKERTGENFKDYLNMYRVKMAKSVLDERPVRIDELSRMVGCNNAVTFTRMFKKYEGTSPSQYARRSGGA
ncbi:helix-turn-helix domain-containing protein [Paenibacillus sp.]|uniref:helix-turn-helix domain-containing protein n=1 Tax=Paenibacillus sp. TaxID=58172 RepID=UPI0028124DFF|nr:helix-turn-helix domain-containing protein [Paenibacillus sp.]